ncbi:MAG: TonB family protein [Flavobacteriales bacterium]|nr:TonB family protein [Flavobacteriales bacterium]
MELLSYLLKVDLLLVLGMLSYAPLRGTTFLQLRRAWILVMLALAFVLPFLSTALVGPVRITYQLPPVTSTSGTGIDGFPGDALSWIARLHGAASALLLLVLLVRIIRTFAVRALPTSGPYSFFRRVVLPEGIDARRAATYLAHERTHVRQWHSADVVLLEVLRCLDWTFPFWGPLRRELRLVHEHLADDAARTTHDDYGSLLLAEAMGVPTHDLVNSFHASDLKTRIQMLYAPRSSRRALRRLALALPTLLLGTLMVSWQAVPMRSGPQKPASTAEQMPEYPGGMPALGTYLSQAIHYPKTAANAGVQGTVMVSFVVSADGRVTDALVKHGVNDALDAEALRVVSTMPNWTPGRDKGKAVAVQMVLPIKFALPDTR